MYITEISKKLKITTRAIRHYEEIGIISSKRLANNYRYFDEANIDKKVQCLKWKYSTKRCINLLKLALSL